VKIDFLVIGHMTRDRVPEGFRLGGTVTYAAATARQLGRQPGILTAGTLDGLEVIPISEGPAGIHRLGGELDGVLLSLVSSPVNTTFANVYRNGRRSQIIEDVASPIVPAHLPPAWADAPLVLLGPLAQELSPAAWAAAFPQATLGVTPQGWMREWDAAGQVHPTRWKNAAPILQRADAVILSREDVGGDEGYIAELAQQARLMVVTDGYHGATLYQDGEATYVPARLTDEVDPTGAGDVFATSFLIRLHETRDPLAATQFAHVVASMSIEAAGMAAIPPRHKVEAWLMHRAAS
jgi:sugar/nucleoside kinase (ribokinase family)